MRKLIISLLSGGLVLCAGFGSVQAQEEEEAERARPIEIFACKFNDGKGLADMQAPIDKFNSWADKRDISEYSAWTLTPYYAGAAQDFDMLWVGASPTAQALGRIQDQWLAEGSKIQAMFDEVCPADAHGNFASLQMKAPPGLSDDDNIVVSFTDCNMADGMLFGDVYPALDEWAKYLEDNGSTAGMWVWFPAYGDGEADFDFKLISAYGNLEEQGVDWDQYSVAGWEKAEELFPGKLTCNPSRVYLATNHRRAADNDE